MAADSLGDAASQMDKAQASLAQAQNNSAAQQAALDALHKAEQQLGQDIAKLEQAEKDLAALEDLLRKLEPIIEEQEKVHTETARESMKPKPDEAPQLASRQDELGKQTGDLQKEATSPAPQAAKHLGDAQQNMSEATSELNKPAAKAAQKEQTEALADLFAAKHAIEKKADELRNMLGLSPEGDMQSLDDAIRAIERAQQEVNQAQSNLEQATPGLMDALQQQQEQIAESLDEMRQENAGAQPVAQAHQAADQAAHQLGRRNLKDAIDSMKKTQGAMQQAMKSEQPAQSTQTDQAPTMTGLSKQQADVQKVAEALLAAQQRAPRSAMQNASKLMQQAGETVLPLTSGEMGNLPDNAEQALEHALEDLGQGSAQAEGGQNQPAQQSAQSASQSLAQAKAALELAQAGLGMQMAQGQQPGQGQQRGQGQQQGRQPGGSKASPRGDSQRGNWDGTGGANGPRNSALGSSAFTGLPKRDRAAILQSQSEKYPQEYGSLVEQYLKNLADQSGN
jgi:hypothetical protein